MRKIVQNRSKKFFKANPGQNLTSQRLIRWFSIEKREDTDLETLEIHKNDLLEIKKLKVKNQVEEYEIEDFSHDYRLSLIENDDKFIKMFEGDDQLLKMREESEKNEKVEFAILNFFGMVLGGLIVYSAVTFLSNIDREVERISPSYLLWFKVKCKSKIFKKSEKMFLF